VPTDPEALVRRLPVVLWKGWVCALAVVGCSSGTEAPPADPAGDDAASSAVASSSSSSTGGVEATHVVASVQQETEVGEAPALIRFANDSDVYLTLYVRDETFSKIDPLTVTEVRAIASKDAADDTTVAYHTSDDTCVKVPFASLAGVTAFEPGHAYTVHVTIADGYHGEITEDELPASFSAIRPVLLDPFPAKTAGASSRVVLQLTETGAPRPVELSFEGIASEYPRAYWLLGEQAQLTSVRFFDRSGGEHHATADVALQGAYTITLSGSPVEGAKATIDLAEQ
jgi:hypothetical protein